MQYISVPQVRLVTRPSINWAAIADFLDSEGLPPIPDSIRSGDDESSAVVEISARLCYMSYGRGRKDISDFINNLLSKGDGSVFEHVNYGFVISGISRSLTHELVRHRAGFAYSQRSQRYVDESESDFIIPPALNENNAKTIKAADVMKAAMESSLSSYKNLVSELDKIIPEEQFESLSDRRKAIRQAARSVLPNATETKIFVTANVRAWRHFIEMRGAGFADWEIRNLAIIILKILEQESPLLFSDFTIDKLPDGTLTAKPKYSKI